VSQQFAIRAVTLSELHLRPGQTKHSIHDQNGQHEFPPFVGLKITHSPDNPGYFLTHICKNGQVADTWHQTLDDAFHQAEWEFGVRPEEWAEINEPW
jgi:hypothetical protein